MKILAWPRAVLAPLLIAILGFLGSGLAGPATSNGAGEQNAGDEYPLPDVVTEWHQVIVTVERVLQTAQATRHDVERQRLLSVMSRQHGKWTPSHPRYRLLDALHGFTRYYEQQKADVDRWRRLYQSVSPSQKKVLEETVSYSSKFRNIEQKLAVNQHLCNDIVEICLHFYNIDMDELKKHMRDREAEGRQADKISVSQALKHIVRDWTEEGSRGRNGTFACLLATLKGLYPKRDVGADKIRVLLPGAGLGRLGHEIDLLGGFEVTMNEWSMCVNAAYRFLEAQDDKTLSRSMSPFVDGWSHHSTNANMVRALGFPDVALRRDAVLLVEGDFTTTFKNHSQYFDVVVTYFFIDTARNLMSYLDTIKDVLKEGGVWINLGPLLYGTAPLVQLSLEDLVAVSERMGFEFLETDEGCGTPTFSKPTVRSIMASYDFDSRALVKNAYQAQFWAARKL